MSKFYSIPKSISDDFSFAKVEWSESWWVACKPEGWKCKLCRRKEICENYKEEYKRWFGSGHN